MDVLHLAVRGKTVLQLRGGVLSGADSDFRTFERFHEVEFLDPTHGATELHFHASREFDARKLFIGILGNHPSQLRWPKAWTVEESGDGVVRVLMRDDAEARLLFHWHCPLTPRGAGLWLGFDLYRKHSSLWTDSGSFLATREQEDGRLRWKRRKFRRFRRKDFLVVQPASQTVDPDVELLMNLSRKFRINGDERDQALEQCPLLGPGSRFPESALGRTRPRSRGSFVLSFERRLDVAGDAAPGRARVEYVSSGGGHSWELNRATVEFDLPAYVTHHRRIHVACAQSLRPGRGHWLCALRIGDEPSGVHEDRLDAVRLWTGLRDHYLAGVRSLRGRRPVSFLPSHLSVLEDRSRVWHLRYEVEESPDGGLRTRFRSVVGSEKLDPEITEDDVIVATVTFGGVSLTDGQPLTRVMAARLPDRRPLTPIAAPGPGQAADGIQRGTPAFFQAILHDLTEDLASSHGKPNAHRAHSVRLGALDLWLRRTPEDPPHKLLDDDDTERFSPLLVLGPGRSGVDQRQHGTALDLRLQLRLLALGAGGQDPEVGAETVSELVERERPIVASLADGPIATGPLLLEVLESASATRSRTFELGIARTADTEVVAPNDLDLVVVDPTPFSAARVRARLEPPDGRLLATWNDDRSGGQWDLSTGDDDLVLLLPPQSVGEEMIRGRPGEGAPTPGGEFPAAGKAFDFRHTPPLRALLRRANVDVARSIAPWNLRRLLGPKWEGSAGADLTALDFELFYGLSAFVTTAGLRLAELEGRYGRIPLDPEIVRAVHDARIDRVPPRDGLELWRTQRAHARDFVSWMRVLLARAARWEPYRFFGDRGPHELSDGVSHRFRTTRATAHPFEPERYAAQAPAADPRNPLRGGVDWIFESRKIYDEVLSRPSSVSSEVEGLAFGPLGGDGTQTARFANGKSIITTVTRGGRVESITLIRIGRISMVWNRARHVIVYQRTVKTPKRFEREQPDDFEGLAALRKVREYVEISECERSYPDFGEAQPTTGGLQACSFPTTQIDVRSAWGRDIDPPRMPENGRPPKPEKGRDAAGPSTRGWVIPLSGPVPPSKEAFYPRPDVRLLLARAAAKGGGSVWRRCSNEERLYFYTSTVRETSDDTDTWPPVPGFDCDVRPVPKPAGMASLHPDDPDATLPDAPPTEIGFEHLTLELEPTSEGMDLTYGRGQEPLEVVVSNVTLARCAPLVSRAPTSSVEERVARPLRDGRVLAGDELAQLHQVLQQQIARDPQGSTETVRRIVERTIASVRGTLADAGDSVDAERERLKGAGRDWNAQQSALLERFQVEVDAAQRRIREQFRDEVLARLGIEPGNVDRNELKANLHALVQQAIGALDTALGRVEAVPERIRLGIQTGRDAVLRELESFLGGGRRRLRTELDRIALEGMAPAQQVAALRRALLPILAEEKRRAVGRVRYLEQDLTGRLRELVERLEIVSADVTVEVDVHGAFDQLGAVLEIAYEAVEELLETAPPFRPSLPDLREAIDQLSVPLAGDLVDEIERLMTALDEGIGGGVKRIECARQQAIEGLRPLAADLLAALDAAVNGAWRTVEELAATVQQALEDHVEGPLQDIAQDLRNEVQEEVQDLIQSPAFALLRGNARDLVDGFRDFVDAGVLRDLQKALADGKNVLELRKTLEGEVAGLEQAWQPITDLASEASRIDFAENPVVAASRTVQLVRAFGDAPVAEALEFSRRRIAYYFDPAEKWIQTTPAAGLFNRVKDSLSPLGIRVPFRELGEKLLPDAIGSLDLSKLLPDFGGLKLDGLFPGLRSPDDGRDNDWLRIRHGFDEKQLRAWARADVERKLDGSPTLLSIGPVAVTVVEPAFDGHSRVEVDANGRSRTETRAQLHADWRVTFGGQDVLTVKDTRLFYDERGKIDFDIQARNVRLAPALDFLADLLQKLAPADSGMSVLRLPEGGVSARLDLPLPDLTGGAFAITGLSLRTNFDLVFAGDFTVRVGLSLARESRPFNITVMCLGGGGWVTVKVAYTPPRTFATELTIGITAGAVLALNLSVASGVVRAQFFVAVTYRTRSGSGSTRGPVIVFGVVIEGELRILGIISVYMGIGFELTYLPSEGALLGRGWIRVKIKICWCFTLKVSKQTTMRLAGPSERSSPSVMDAEPSARAVSSTAAAPAEVPVADAVTYHFATLAVD